MNRFDRNGLRRFRARDGVLALLVCAALLIVFKGDSLRRQGERMDPGVARDLVMAVARPAGAVPDAPPFARATGDATAVLSPGDRLHGAGGVARGAGGAGGQGAPRPPGAVGPA